MGEFGHGLITSTHQDSNQLFAGLLGTNATGAGTLRVDSLSNTAAPDAVPAMAGASIDLIAWQQSSGGAALPEIRVRYSSDGITFGPELVLSSPALGPTDADLGLAAAGDYSGNAAVAWVQGSGDSTEIVADQLYEPPSNFVASTRFRYVRSARPRLTLVGVARPLGAGPVHGHDRLGAGVPHRRDIARAADAPQRPTHLGRDSLEPGRPERQHARGQGLGRHRPAARQLCRSGVVRQVGRTIRVFVTTDDHPPGVSAASASGTVSVTVRWGAGKSTRIVHSSSHVFTKPGRYKLTIVATDRAGNKTTVVRSLTIKPKPKPRRRRRRASGHRRSTRGESAMRAAIKRTVLAGARARSFGVTAVAHAQGPAYAAQPPSAHALYADGQTGRYLLGGTWLYRADRANVGISQGWWRDVAATDGWTPVAVPNSYNAGDFSPASMNGYVGWYRKDFTLPAGAFASYVPAAARRWIIRFESVNYRATVWLNGRQIGTHAGAYLPFEFDIAARSGVNRLIVRVDDRRGGGDLPPGPGGGWWNFGGIQREVYLRAVQRADLQQVQVRPILPCSSCPATIEEQASVRNPTAQPQTVALHGTYGSVRLDFGSTTIAPHATWTAQATIDSFNHPRLWSIDHPNLYRATLTLADATGPAPRRLRDPERDQEHPGGRRSADAQRSRSWTSGG